MISLDNKYENEGDIGGPVTWSKLMSVKLDKGSVIKEESLMEFGF